MYQSHNNFYGQGYGAAAPRALPYEPNLPPAQSNGPQIKMPAMDETAATALLQHLDKQELQGLMENETKQEDLVADLQQVKNIQVERETLLASNKSMAEYNLSYQPQLENKKGELATGHEEIKRLQGVMEEHRGQLLLSSDGQNTEMLLALLQTECAKTEEESEQLAENFCDKNVEVDPFLEQFISLRTLAHLRRVKCDKMVELVQSSTQRPPVVPRRTNPNTAKGWYPPNGTTAVSPSYSAPYPANNPYMMMPEPFLPR